MNINSPLIDINLSKYYKFKANLLEFLDELSKEGEYTVKTNL